MPDKATRSAEEKVYSLGLACGKEVRSPHPFQFYSPLSKLLPCELLILDSRGRPLLNPSYTTLTPTLLPNRLSTLPARDTTGPFSCF